MMSRLWRIIALSAFIAAGSVLGYTEAVEQPVVITMDMGNFVQYRGYLTGKLGSDVQCQDPRMYRRHPEQVLDAGFRVSRVTGAGATIPARAWLDIGYNL